MMLFIVFSAVKINSFTFSLCIWGPRKHIHLHLSALQVFGAPMGPGESSGGHMMPGGSPGIGPGMGSQFMGQQSYGEAVTKGYGQSVMYGRPSPAYNPASAYGGRYSNLHICRCTVHVEQLKPHTPHKLLMVFFCSAVAVSASGASYKLDWLC